MIIDGGEAKDIYISGLRVRRIQMFGETVYELASALSIEGPSEYSGKYFLLSAYQDNQKVYPQTWSITSGNQYATINSNGRVDINSNTSTQQNITVTATYGNATASKIIGVLYDTQFIIVCADTITGTSGNYQVFYDGNDVTSTATITITSGTATVASGDIAFNASGSLTFYATYNGFTSQPKTTMLVYNSNAETETTVDPDTGETTTTTTITETDPQTGETTTSTTTIITQEDGSESTTNSETVTQTDGSSSTNSTTTNSDGTSSENTINVASDGSSTSTTTNYDANGDPTSGSNNTTDTSGNSNTQEITYDESGNPEVTGYTIDTTNNPSGNGEEITTGLDTGVIVFDGNDWEATLTFKVHDYLTFSNNPFFSAMYKENNKANGIVVYGFRSYGGTHYNENDTAISNSTSTNPVMRMKVNEWIKGSIQSDSYEFYSKHKTAYSSYRFGTRTNPLTLKLKATCNGNTLTIELYYNNQITAKPRYSKTYTFNSASDKNVTFKLGEMTSNTGTTYAQNFEVLDFVVRKL